MHQRVQLTNITQINSLDIYQRAFSGVVCWQVRSFKSSIFDPQPSQQFGNLFNAYTKAMNKIYERTGSLFENPSGRVPVASESHLVHLVAYIHQNPERHGLVEDFRMWAHSSYRALVSQGPTHLERDEVLAWFQDLAVFEDAHRRPVAEAQIARLVPGDVEQQYP